jgi:uncharacterized protein
MIAFIGLCNVLTDTTIFGQPLFDLILVIISLVLLILGLIGCFISVIPGPPLSWAGLFALSFTSYSEISTTFLIIWAIVAVATIIADYIFPVKLTQKLGGTKAGIRGATIGMLLGLFCYAPVGVIIGPIIGALVGELIAKKGKATAFRSALGAFLGFLLTTGIKLIVVLLMVFYWAKDLFF